MFHYRLMLFVAFSLTLFITQNSSAQERKKPVPLPKPKVIRKKPDPRARPQDEQLKDLLIKNTKSESRYVQRSAFITLSHSEDVIKSLGKDLRPTITAGLRSADSKVVTSALAMLDNSGLSKEDQLPILIDAAGQGDSRVMERLFAQQDAVLEAVTFILEKAPQQRHDSLYAILEYFGPDGAPAIDALLKNYDTKNPVGSLTIDEVREMKATFLLEEVDQNKDKMVSEEEYLDYLKVAPKSQSTTVMRTSRSR